MYYQASTTNKPLKVLHFCGCFSKLSETFIYDLVTGISRKGFDCSVVTYKRELEQSRPFDKVHVLKQSSRRSPEGIARRLIDKVTLGDAKYACWPMEQRRLEKVVRQIKPDLIHSHFGGSGAKMAPVALRLNVPMITTFHGYDATRLPRQPFWRKKLQELCRLEKATVGVSENICSKLRELGAPSSSVFKIANGINLTQFPHGRPSERYDGRHIEWLFVGRLTEKKGVLYLTESFRKALEMSPSGCEPILHIVGDGEETPFLKQMIEREGLGSKVILHGSKPHSFVREMMAKCHLHAQHSVTADDGDQEGQPVGLIEASASGLPIVSTRHSGIPEIVKEGENGFLVDERDTDTMAQRMAFLNRHPETWDEMGYRGREHVEQNMQLDRQIDVWKGLYENIAHQHQTVTPPVRKSLAYEAVAS